ncbi:MAG: hypothetical protein LH629_12840 [Ignavibacteria bacterium]|nr:hypothetical protein [Ignavibacteria bacterium]
MESEKKLGIWMDHSHANLIEYKAEKIEEIEEKVITSNFTHQEKEKSLSKSESLMHNKEQQRQAEFYKKLGEVVKNYTDVILFGPTDAKVELFNNLRADHNFAKIKIEVMQKDKMTENQQHAFVKEYFSK